MIRVGRSLVLLLILICSVGPPALGQSPGPKEIKKLARDVRSPNFDKAVRALQDTGRGPEHGVILLEALKSRHDYIRIDALRSLSFMEAPPPEALERVLKLLRRHEPLPSSWGSDPSFLILLQMISVPHILFMEPLNLDFNLSGTKKRKRRKPTVFKAPKLDDGEGTVRAVALTFLIRHGEEKREVIEDFLDAAPEPGGMHLYQCSDLRIVWSKAIQELGHDLQVELIGERLKSTHVGTQALGLESMWVLKQPAPLLLPDVLSLLKSEEPAIRLRAMQQLERVGASLPEAGPQLLASLGERELALRLLAVRESLRLGDVLNGSGEIVLDAFQCKQEPWMAAQALQCCRWPDELPDEIVSYLIPMLESRAAPQVVATLEALEAFGSRARSAKLALLQLRSGAKPKLLEHIMQVLRALE